MYKCYHIVYIKNYVQNCTSSLCTFNCGTTQLSLGITGINAFFATVFEKTDDTRTPKKRWLLLVNNEMFHQFGSCTKCATDS